jgi:hypothetical protein
MMLPGGRLSPFRGKMGNLRFLGIYVSHAKAPRRQELRNFGELVDFGEGTVP